MSAPNTRHHAARASAVQKVFHVPWISNRLFYGWIIVAVGFVTQFFQGVINQGFGTYLPILEAQFGWSKAILAMPRSIAQINNSIIGPLEGFLVDRFGPRRVVATGVFIMGGGLILFGLTNHLWLYFASNITVAVGTGFQGLLVMSVAVNNWFRRKRSIAQSVMLLGFSLAGVVGVPALVLVQASMGWRTSAIGSGILIWAAGFPTAMLLRTRPETYGLLPDGDIPHDQLANGEKGEAAEYNFSLKEAIHTRAFWLLALGWAEGNMGIVAVQVHLFLYLDQELGLSRTTAALIWTVASLSNMPARLLGGFFGDRLPKIRLLAFSLVLMSASIYILGKATNLQMAFAYAVIYGIGWGIRTPVMNALQADYFGRKSLGVIMGWLQSTSIPLTITAPVMIGFFADYYGSYRVVFIYLSIIMVVGAFLVFLATPPRPPACGR